MSSNFLANGAFRLIYQFCKSGKNRFVSALSRVEEVQRNKLRELLRISANSKYGKENKVQDIADWEEFNERFPVTGYSDWSGFIERQRKGEGFTLSGASCNRYQPTSGSTSNIKWIPYTKTFLSELDEAISILIAHHYEKDSKPFKGKQYWSLSWIPTEHRKIVHFNSSDDMELLPWYKRLLMYLTMAVPEKVAYAKTSEGSMVATLAYLLKTRDLSLISVWSPTFALNLFDQIKLYREELIHILKNGRWLRWTEDLSLISCPRSKEAAEILEAWDGVISSDFLRRLWPRLSMVSSWASSTSKIWAQKLRKLFPDCPFQEKGLWATEGVVTLPFEGNFPLAVTSHFYEFLDLKTQEIHPAWNLKTGQIVKPLLTTGSGFFRYALNDRIQVTDFIEECPCFLFLGRMDGIDMVGEKTSAELAQKILEKVGEKLGVQPLTIIGLVSRNQFEKPYYLLCCEGKEDGEIKKNTTDYLEALLLESFHYRLARDLNQLDHAKVLFHPNAAKFFQKRALQKGMALGNMKIEPLLLLEKEELAPLKKEHKF